MQMEISKKLEICINSNCFALLRGTDRWAFDDRRRIIIDSSRENCP